MKAIILAAGRSTRLGPLTADRPKCLLRVGGHTILERHLMAIDLAGLDKVVLVTEPWARTPVTIRS